MAGDTTTLDCVTDGVANSNIRWYEYVTNSVGVLISDGDTLLPSHPNADRYELVLSDSRTIALKINNIKVNDAGYYQCQDSNAAPPSITRLGAQLVVLGTSSLRLGSSLATWTAFFVHLYRFMDDLTDTNAWVTKKKSLAR